MRTGHQWGEPMVFFTSLAAEEEGWRDVGREKPGLSVVLKTTVYVSGVSVSVQGSRTNGLSLLGLLL